jgi:uncharacterized membrane protein
MKKDIILPLFVLFLTYLLVDFLLVALPLYLIPLFILLKSKFWYYVIGIITISIGLFIFNYLFTLANLITNNFDNESFAKRRFVLTLVVQIILIVLVVLNIKGIFQITLKTGYKIEGGLFQNEESIKNMFSYVSSCLVFLGIALFNSVTLSKRA